MSRLILKQPVAVFDAGIGSYAIARKIVDRFPYFADRSNFPYGGKG
jgi:glutamate racemase